MSKGKVARQAHVGLPEGTYEEEHGREAFKGRAAHLYRSHPPTAWIRIEGPLRPSAFDLNAIKPDDLTDAAAEPFTVLLGNDDVRIGIARRRDEMPYFLRDADGDLCYFVHDGAGILETDYGPLLFSKGDYLIVPKGTTHRFVPTSELFVLVIEGSGEYRIPDRGILGRHAQFDPGVLGVPEPEPHDEVGEFEVWVKRDGQYTRLVYPHHPLDVVGWQGDLCPVRLSVDDFRPIVSPRYHLPPSVHTTWVNQGFDVCTFAPRPTETGDPGALRVPFFHSNIDNDEVIFYHSGQFFSRAGIGPGMMTLHPQGLHHGPQQAAIEASGSKEFADEVAVMVETTTPLAVAPALDGARVEGYETSWAKGMGLI